MPNELDNLALFGNLSGHRSAQEENATNFASL